MLLANRLRGLTPQFLVPRRKPGERHREALPLVVGGGRASSPSIPSQSLGTRMGEGSDPPVNSSTVSFIPWRVASTPQSASPTPLLVKHEIVSLPSASTIAVLRNQVKGRSPAAKTVAVLADPVFSRNEDRLKHRGGSGGAGVSAPLQRNTVVGAGLANTPEGRQITYKQNPPSLMTKSGCGTQSRTTGNVENRAMEGTLLLGCFCRARGMALINNIMSG